MRRTLLPFIMLIIASTKIFANPINVWHVSTSGNDANSGKSVRTAFLTLQKAAGVVQPGDTVLIGNGVYTNTNIADGGSVLSISTSGTEGAWITWKPEKGQHPQIKPVGWSGILILGSYQIIDGIDVVGSNDSLTLIDALEDAKKTKPNPVYNTNGIVVDGRSNNPDNKPHHIIIRHCSVGKCGGGGITMLETDYVTVENCKVFENAWFMRYAGSGITTLNNWAFDDKPGYHMIIRQNMVWYNKTMVPWNTTGRLSDGNGILLDVTDQEQGATNPNGDATVGDTTKKRKLSNKPKRPEWKCRALIADNLSVYNGGSGIHTFRTKGVDIINNTTYWNGQIVGYQELFPNRCDDIVILNNIIVPKPGGKVTSDNRNTHIQWDYNLYPSEQNVFKGQHDIVADPQFINAQINVAIANFMLKKTSSGLNSGTLLNLQPVDLRGIKRPRGKGVDRGCYEQ